MTPPPYVAASFVGLASAIVMVVLVGAILLTGRRSQAPRIARCRLTFFLIRNPAAALGDGVRHRGLATPPVTRSAARFAGVAGAIAMVALIGAISLTGRWPSGESFFRDPEVRGILAVPADQVAHVQVSIGEKDLVFLRGSEGGWLVNGAGNRKGGFRPCRRCASHAERFQPAASSQAG